MPQIADKRRNKICSENIEDPDDYENLILNRRAAIRDVTSSESNHGDQTEGSAVNYYLLEVFVDKIQLIPEPVVVNDEDEFLDDDAKRLKEAEEERKRSIRAKLMTRVKFFELPTVEVEREEYKEPEVKRKKKEFKQWTHEEEDEEEERNWMAELKEQLKQIEREEQGKQEAMNTPPNIVEDEAAKYRERREMNEVIGKSCFFSMTPTKLEHAINNSKVSVSIYQIGDARLKTKSKLIGEAFIKLDHTYITGVRRACCPMIRTPVTVSVKEDYEIFSPIENKTTAIMTLHIRLLCMGYTPYPELKHIPKPVEKRVSEIETLITNLKAMNTDELARTCPMLKTLRTPRPQ